MPKMPYFENEALIWREMYIFSDILSFDDIDSD